MARVCKCTRNNENCLLCELLPSWITIYTWQSPSLQAQAFVNNLKTSLWTLSFFIESLMYYFTKRSLLYVECECPLSSVDNLASFQTPLATFFFLKRLVTNLATFGKTLATFQMWPVLSCEREILSYTSPCVCSDQWALAPAERSSTFSDRSAADIDVNELCMCTRCCHGPITCLLHLCLK